MLLLNSWDIQQAALQASRKMDVKIWIICRSVGNCPCCSTRSLDTYAIHSCSSVGGNKWSPLLSYVPQWNSWAFLACYLCSFSGWRAVSYSQLCWTTVQEKNWMTSFYPNSYEASVPLMLLPNDLTCIQTVLTLNCVYFNLCFLWNPCMCSHKPQ